MAAPLTVLMEMGAQTGQKTSSISMRILRCKQTHAHVLILAPSCPLLLSPNLFLFSHMSSLSKSACSDREETIASNSCALEQLPRYGSDADVFFILAAP